ncbi:MAG: HAD hydrolase family protein [Armatimonadetes bacterium]|nr:HAD hydrolase family protein [Armatimonadota bacterium]
MAEDPECPAAGAIRLLAMDVDGVLTDGVLYQTSAGEEMKAFHVRDGMGIALARHAGLEVAFVTARASAVVRRRAAELGVRHVLDGVRDKRAALAALVERLGLAAHAVAFIGDDLNDLPAFAACALSIAVADAPPRVREAAMWVTRAPGGRGAIREVVERLLNAQGSLEAAIARYLEASASAEQ